MIDDDIFDHPENFDAFGILRGSSHPELHRMPDPRPFSERYPARPDSVDTRPSHDGRIRLEVAPGSDRFVVVDIGGSR